MFLNAGQRKIVLQIPICHILYKCTLIVFIFKCPESTITNVCCQVVGSFLNTKQDDYDIVNYCWCLVLSAESQKGKDVEEKSSMSGSRPTKQKIEMELN